MPKVTLGGDDGHAIHVYAKGADGSKVRLDFGQGTEMTLGGSQGALDLGLHPLGRLSPYDLVFPDAGGVVVTKPPTVDSPGNDIAATAWVLVKRAAEACAVAGGQRGLLTQLPPWGPATDHDFASGSYAWYVYEAINYGTHLGLADDCATRAYVAQNLVCVADKLAEVADAVTQVVWPPLLGGECPNPYSYGAPDANASTGCQFWAEWDIPPQADADRFILRDLAIHSLAMIPALDGYEDILNQSCATTFAQAAAGQVSAVNTPDTFDATFGVPPGSATDPRFPVFPPSDVPFIDASGHDNTATIAASALQIQAQILRSGGRLLHDLIRRDVYSDMASASKRAAQAMAPDTGNAAAWGVRGQSPYGSISHAARVLLGRWEIGDTDDFPTTADPQCAGIPSLGLVPGAFVDLDARLADFPIRTKGEAIASQLVDSAGIVLPACKIDATGSVDSGTADPALQTLLIDQLLAQEQRRNGAPVQLDSPQRTVFERTVAAATSDELAFAFRRALATYALVITADLTPAAAGDAGAAACVPLAVPMVVPAGLTFAAPLPGRDLVGSLGGLVVAGGLDRSRLVTDPMARAAGMLEASQCGESSGDWSEWGVSTKANPPFSLPRADFQDVFHVGQAFERRLAHLALAAAPLGGSSSAAPGTDATGVASGGLAELRSWAGSVLAHSWIANVNGTDVIQVRLSGVPYADLGLNPGLDPAVRQATITNTFGFVYGAPWVAECAAHVRPGCPATFDADYIQPAVAVDDSASPPPTPGLTADGTLGSVVLLTVPFTASGAQPPQYYEPQVTAQPTSDHLYMVRLHDPGDPAGHGHVMGIIPLRGVRVAFPSTVLTPIRDVLESFVDSPMQRELVHDAIDLGKWVGATPPRLGDQSAAQTSGYCVDGVRRDVFVPLDNSLNASAGAEESWQHYLTVARQAADTADALGKDLITDDLAISENQQAAQQNLATYCGDFALLSGAKVGQDGTITVSGDPTTAPCLSEETKDVVFLGGFPPDLNDAGVLADGGNTTDYLRGTILKCDAGLPYSTDELCDKTAHKTLSAAALNITPPAPPPGDPNGTLEGACADVQKAATSLTTPFNGLALRSAVNDGAFTTDSLSTLVADLRMNVHTFNDWDVAYAGEPFMSTTDEGLWPACLRGTPFSKVAPRQLPLAKLLNSAFRWCSLGRSIDGSPLGSCDGGGPYGETAEINTLKWRVMQALWMLAASAGTAPAGLFHLPFPIATFPAANGSVPFSLAFPGQFASDPAIPLLNDPHANTNTPFHSVGASRLLVPPSTQAEWSVMDDVYDVAQEFGIFTAAANQELPDWYLSLYGQSLPSSSLKHRWFDSPEVPFYQLSYGTALSGAAPSWMPDWIRGNAQAAQPFPVSLGSVLDLAPSLDGLACANPWGESTPPGPIVGPPGKTYPFWLWVASLTDSPQFDRRYDLFEDRDGFDVCHFSPTDAAGPLCGVHQNVIQYVNNDDWLDSVQPAPSSEAPCNGPLLVSSTASADFGACGSAGVPDILHSNPWWRFPILFGANPNTGTCGTLSRLVQAAAVVCASNGATLERYDVTAPPVVSTVAGLAGLEAWLDITSRAAAASVGRLYAEQIPKRVVDDMTNQTVGSGDKRGTKGAAILEMEQALPGLWSDWSQIATDLAQVKNAIRTAHLALTGAKITEQSAAGEIALRQISVEGAMAQSSTSFMSSVLSALTDPKTYATFGGTAVVNIATGAAATSAAIDTGEQTLQGLNAQLEGVDEKEANDVATILSQMNTTVQPLWQNLQASLDGIRSNLAKVEEDAQQIQLIQNQAQYQVAIGTGQDFVSIAGKEVPIPVDTVLRRQASATAQRYQAALVNAKALAY
ncbi:MAG TPA: hypothetical protein VGI39_16740, partial [Polyangiaceae bacterium]